MDRASNRCPAALQSKLFFFSTAMARTALISFHSRLIGSGLCLTRCSLRPMRPGRAVA